VVIGGLVQLVAGRRFLGRVLFPLLYLVLMIPIVNLSSDRIHWPFQLITATIASKAIALFGVPVLQSRNLLHMPRVSLEVANVCSGARFFLSIVAIAVPLAYLTQTRLRRRAVLVAAAILISVLTNAARVALIGLWAHYSGRQGDIHGPFHVLQGLFVSVVGYVVLFVFAVLYADPAVPGRRAAQEPGGSGRPLRATTAMVRAGSLALFILGAALAYTRLVPLRVIPPAEAAVAVPETVGGWRSVPPTRLQRLPGADRESNGAYRRDGAEIGIYRAYFAFQKQGRECVESGSKWGAAAAEELQIRLAEGGTASVNKVVYVESGRRVLGLYWYDTDGKVISGRYLAKALTAWNGMVRNRNNGAVVLVYRSIEPPERVDAAAADLEGFLRESGLLERSRSAGLPADQRGRVARGETS
jgi:EpsI family protein